METRELERRGRPHAGRHPRQRADHRERAALGSRPAAADLRPAAGDPHLLRLRLGGRRPLLDRREVPAGAALAAGAQRRVAADPDLHQRAPDLHPRDGAHPGPGQPGHHRGAAGAVHQGPAAGVDRVAQGHAGRRSTTASWPTTTSFVGTRQREFDHPVRRGERLRRLRGDAAACRSAICCAALVLAARFGSSKILLSQDITNDSRVLYYREHRRAGEEGAAVPPLRPRSLPGGRRPTARSQWILDAYTTSRRLSLRRSGWPTAPTTCGTASSWSSTRTTARSPPT